MFTSFILIFIIFHVLKNLKIQTMCLVPQLVPMLADHWQTVRVRTTPVTETKIKELERNFCNHFPQPL